MVAAVHPDRVGAAPAAGGAPHVLVSEYEVIRIEVISRIILDLLKTFRGVGESPNIIQVLLKISLKKHSTQNVSPCLSLNRRCTNLVQVSGGG